jgi:hypothetical protein
LFQFCIYNINQGLKNPLARRPGLVISTFGLAEINSCMPDVLWRVMQFFYLLCSQFQQKASGWINKTLMLIKQHITYMNISRYANIDKFKWNTGIGFRNRERLFPVLPIAKKNKELMPTDPRFFWHVTVNTHVFFLALQWPELWKISENKTQYQTLMLIKQHITYMNISRYANIDKFVNIRYFFLLVRRAYSWLFQLAQM